MPDRGVADVVINAQAEPQQQRQRQPRLWPGRPLELPCHRHLPPSGPLAAHAAAAGPGDTRGRQCGQGQLGGAAAELRGLFSGKTRRARAQSLPRIEIGRELRERELATAMIDVSDGLSTDLHHICEESRVGARIHADRVPRAEQVSLDLALNGGEDYELLFTAPQSKEVPRRIAGVPITNIGETTSGRKIVLVKGGSRTVLPARGWTGSALSRRNSWPAG